jgi:hypothetical protein
MARSFLHNHNTGTLFLIDYKAWHKRPKGETSTILNLVQDLMITKWFRVRPLFGSLCLPEYLSIMLTEILVLEVTINLDTKTMT